MKKFFTLLLLTASALTFPTTAQTTNCTAGFTTTISGLSVNFVAAISTDPTINQHVWKFGDGTGSTAASPVHLYSSGGAYTVTHVFYRKGDNGSVSCVDSITKRIELNGPSVACNLHAGFSFERDAVHPNKVYFKNNSQPSADIHAVKWNFGDGTYSTDFSPSHVFNTSGLFRVCLIVERDNGCKSDTCANVQIQLPPPPCNVEAYFASHADSIHLNKIYFVNLSPRFEKTDSIRWTFGDGTSSYDINPVHTYNAPGTYNVCIRIKRNLTSSTTPCVKEYCKQVVVVSGECRLEPNFTFEADATNKNKIYFKNASVPVSSVTYVQWSFGDGTTSNAINPDHVYAKPGIYNVCLKVANSNTCFREKCKTIEIRETEINCLEISTFNVIRSTANCLEFKFIPAVQNVNWKYVWAFGDGTGSTEISPSHVYPRSGNYTVSLTVYRSAGCVSTSSKVAETGPCFSCNNIWVKYEYKRESSVANTLYFHALSNYPLLAQTWTITKLTISGSQTITLNQANPVYTFKEPGDYRVCLRAITAGQCVKEYCQVIHVGAATECILNAYPNPAINQVSVNVSLTSPEIIHLYIFNSLNILVKQKDQQGNTGNNVVTTNIEGLVPGLYTIKVIYGNRTCYAKFQK